MSKTTAAAISTLLSLASIAFAFAGCSSGPSPSAITTSSRAGIYEIHQTVRQASPSEMARIQALADDSAGAAAEAEAHSTTEDDSGH